MLWLLTLMTFLATLIIVAVVFYALSPGKVDIMGRLSRISGVAVPHEEPKFVEKQTEKMRAKLADLGKMLPAPSTQKVSRDKLLIIRAGYRDPDAILTIRGLKLLFPIAVLATVYFTGVYRTNPYMFLPGAFIAGYLLPDFWLTWRVRRRQHRLRRGLP